MTDGFLVVDKPSGVTSNSVVGRVRRITGIKKVGHAGTLDPLATGAVVVAVGRVTRLIRYIQDQPKEYLAVAEFGVATDTLDADGAILSREPMDFDQADLEEVAGRFIGTIHQVPPMVSALKHEGRRLYELAREGTVVEREARPVVVYELEIVSVGTGPYPIVEFRVVCGKGTYVRAIADDLAAALGGSAHLTSLRRTRIGDLNVREHGIGLGSLEDWEEKLIPAAEALGTMPAITVDGSTARAVTHGMRFVGADLGGSPGVTDDGLTRILDAEGDLLAVYRRTGEQMRPEVVLPT